MMILRGGYADDESLFRGEMQTELRILDLREEGQGEMNEMRIVIGNGTDEGDGHSCCGYGS